MHRKEKQIMHQVKKSRAQREHKNDSGMTPYLAMAIAEGFKEGEHATQEQMIEAWQYLHDTKLGYKLQGFYGRTLKSLIENNIITQ